jgi:phage baseplate assembly protein gpV
VKIPALLGADSEVSISYIGRKVPWVVPTIGDQIVVTSDDANLTNVFWLQTDQIAQPTTSTTFDYKVGDTGPGGGVIFFVDRFNEYPGFTYLEVAPSSTEVSRTWTTNVNSNQTTAVSGADSKALGAGHQNTIDIVAQAGNVAATCAAAYCADLTSGGQSDWYLPSLAEMKMVYDVVHLNLSVGGFVYNQYWTSSEYDATTAWNQNFQQGGQSTYPGKSYSTYVRPVRRF